MWKIYYGDCKGTLEPRSANHAKTFVGVVRLRCDRVAVYLLDLLVDRRSLLLVVHGIEEEGRIFAVAVAVAVAVVVGFALFDKLQKL